MSDHEPRPTRVDRRAGLFARTFARFATTGVARFLSRHIAWKLDPVLLRLTGGRLVSTLVFPTGLLETLGARSGAARRNAIIYFCEGDRYLIAGSNAGSARHPGWYFNLLAEPNVLFGGVPMRAEVVTDQGDLDRLWKIGDRVFPAYRTYRQQAAARGRQVPLVQLTKQEAGTT